MTSKEQLKNMCNNIIADMNEIIKELDKEEEVVVDEYDFAEVLYDSLDNRKKENDNA